MKAGFDGERLQAALADHRTAGLDPRLGATLGFLEKLTLSPEAVGPADAEVARAAGVSDAALEEAIRVCFCFCVIDRLADALDFPLPNRRSLRWAARTLLWFGYRGGTVPGGE